MNKFEQVFSDHHQRSLAGGGSPGLMSWGGGGGKVPRSDECPGEKSTYLMSGQGGVSYHVTYPMIHFVFVTYLPKHNERQTPVKKLPSHNFVGGR